MTRSALIIGLGGTGQWVLTYLKKDLIESNNGQFPKNVRLICFDTMPQATAEIAATGVNRKGDKEVKVGSVRLEKNVEFVHLGGDIHEISEAICEDSKRQPADQRLTHLSSWFQACYWLDNVPPAIFRLADGAGQLRQFGRMGLFKDFTNPGKSEVWRRLDAVISQLDQVRQGQRLEIIIVGSFAGGTGSGLFIDLALVTRYRARNAPFMLRGYFVLPRAFDADADQSMLARSFAAWRELNRFMVVNQDFALPRMIFNSKDTNLQIPEVRQKAFDVCYLVDGVRGGARIATEAELGVHPSVADAISTILDDKAGDAYNQWADNMLKEYAANPGVPLYSTVGTHTFKVPVYYAQQDFSRRFTANWLEKLVKPVRDDPQNAERVTRVDCTSPRDPAKTGRQESLDMLVSPQEYGGNSEAPTLFFQRIRDILEQGGADSPSQVEQFARGSYGGQAWTDALTNIGERLDMADVIKRIRQETSLRVGSVIKTSRDLKEPTKDFQRRVEKNLGQLVREHYGYRTATGEEVRGLFGAALDECARAQVDIFRRQAELWLLGTLMSGDKSGRIGYIYDLLDGLRDELTAFLAFMDKVRDERQQTQPYMKAMQAQEKAKRALQAYAGRKLVGVVDHPRAHETQTVYLKAEQAVIDARKDELMHDTVIRTARQMVQTAAQIRDEVGRWIQLLATGDPATGVEGLFTVLDRERREIEQTQAADAQLAVVQTQLGEMAYPQAQEPEELKRLMSSVNWSIEPNAGRFKLRLVVQPANEARVELETATGQERVEVRQSLTQRNMAGIQSYAVQRFSNLPEETRIAQRLRQEFTPESFAEKIGTQAEPLFDRQAGQEGGAAAWSELMRISTDGVDAATLAFITRTIQVRRVTHGLPPDVRSQRQLVEAVGSADTHKCTIVRTDDLMPVDLFRSWHECMKAYFTNKEMPPHLNHNFPAEINASKFELRLAEKRQVQYRVFHPWVVMLLEHPEQLEQFFLCWALEWLQPQNDGARSWYELNVPTFERPFVLTPHSDALWSAFQAARFFALEGVEQVTNSTRKLDYNAVRNAIEAEERQRGPDAWLAFLREQAGTRDSAPLGEHLIVRWLRQRAAELDIVKKNTGMLPAGEPRDYAGAYLDLADVAQLMLEERLARKENQLGLDRQSRARATAPGSPAAPPAVPPAAPPV